MFRRFLLLALVLIFVIGLPTSPPLVVAAPAEGRLFPETGWRVGGRLLEVWETQGGAAVFGLPIGAAETRGTQTTQIFERVRLEWRSDLRAPNDVAVSALSAEVLTRLGRDWREEGSGQPMGSPCKRFAQTDRTVCGVFLAAWQGRGLNLGDPGVSERESLALWGLPLTAPRQETNSSGVPVVAQWFERARLELHRAATVQRGRLGAEWSRQLTITLPAWSVVVTPSVVTQGHRAAFEVRIANAVAVRGTLGGVALPVVFSGGQWRGMLGVPVLAPVGKLPLVVEADLRDGRTVQQTVFVQVADAQYPRERINLPKAVQDRLNNNRDAIAKERLLVNAIWPQVTPEKLWSGAFVLPTQGRISSQFGTLRSYNGGPFDSFHEGLDIANATGTPVVASARGRVVLAEKDLIVRGGAVILDHGWGLHTAFWHQSEVLVKVGQLVEAGEIIGRIGAQGMVTGPHLHWDVRIGPTNVSPLEWTTGP